MNTYVRGNIRGLWVLCIMACIVKQKEMQRMIRTGGGRFGSNIISIYDILTIVFHVVLQVTEQ